MFQQFDPEPMPGPSCTNCGRGLGGKGIPIDFARSSLDAKSGVYCQACGPVFLSLMRADACLRRGVAF